MKISRRNLRRIVREACGDLPPIQVEAEPVVVSEPAPVVESQEPVQQLVVEMELASRALEQVVESVQNAAHVCHDCGEQLAAQAPLMEAMASQAIRPRVGCVGALLLYPNGNIQHGGVIVGMHSGADHAYRDLKPAHNVHRSRSQLLTGWGAVTGACMMLRKALLEEVGGFDEGLPVEFNDVDLCLRLGQLGYRHVIPPEAVLLHHESKSRDSKRSQTALQALKRLQQRWLGRFSQAGPWWPTQSERNCADGRPLGLEGMENR